MYFSFFHLVTVVRDVFILYFYIKKESSEQNDNRENSCLNQSKSYYHKLMNFVVICIG